MQSNTIIKLTYIVNLILVNIVIYIAFKNYHPIGRAIIFHIVSSLITIGALSMIFKKTNRNINIYKSTCKILLFSFIVPFLSMYLVFSGYAIINGKYKMILSAIVVSIHLCSVNWYIWIIFCFVNIIFVLYHSNTINRIKSN